MKSCYFYHFWGLKFSYDFTIVNFEKKYIQIADEYSWYVGKMLDCHPTGVSSILPCDNFYYFQEVLASDSTRFLRQIDY